MEIDAEKSTIGPEEKGIPISAAADGTIIRAPTIETTRAQTTVSASSGETIVLGGLITKSHSITTRSVPYLSDIPFIGDLFRYDNKTDRRTELIIILTPQIIHGPDDNERIKQAEMARLSWCMADVYDIHGDVNYQFQDHAMLFDQPTEVIYPDEQPAGLVELSTDAIGHGGVGDNPMQDARIGNGPFQPEIITSPIGRQ